jgi:hypothetical protein
MYSDGSAAYQAKQFFFFRRKKTIGNGLRSPDIGNR